MPTYRFLDEKSGKEFDEFMSISDKEGYLKENSHLRQVYTPIALAGDHLMGVGPKVDGGFNENIPAAFSILDSPSSTSSLTYQVYAKTTGGTSNYGDSDARSTITAFEIGA